MDSNTLDRTVSAKRNVLIFWVFIIILLLQGVVIFLTAIYPFSWVIVLAVLGISLITYTVIKLPVCGIYILLFSIFGGLLTGGRVGYKEVNIFYTDIVMLLLLFLITIRGVVEGREKIGRSSLIIGISFFALVLISFLSLSKAVDLLRGLATLRAYIYGLLVFLLVTTFAKKEEQIRTFFWVLVLWGITLAIMEISFVLHQQSILLALYSKQLILSFGRSNYLAAFHALLIPLCASVIFSKGLSKCTKFTLTVAVLLMGVGILFTGSRGGVMGSLVGLFIVILRFLRRRTLLVLIGFLILMSVVIFFNPATKMLFQRMVHYKATSSALVRLECWGETWKVFNRNFILGVGIGNLNYHLKHAFSWYVSSHNLFLDTLAETGIIGFISLLFLFGYVIRIGISNCLDIKTEFYNCLSWGILASIAASLTHSMVEPTFVGFQFSILFWSVVGIMVNISVLRKNLSSQLYE